MDKELLGSCITFRGTNVQKLSCTLIAVYALLYPSRKHRSFQGHLTFLWNRMNHRNGQQVYTRVNPPRALYAFLFKAGDLSGSINLDTPKSGCIGRLAQC